MPDISIDFPAADETVGLTFAVGGRLSTDGPGTVVCNLYERGNLLDTKVDVISATGFPVPWSVTFSVTQGYAVAQVVAEFSQENSNQVDASATLDPFVIEA